MKYEVRILDGMVTEYAEDVLMEAMNEGWRISQFGRDARTGQWWALLVKKERKI